MIARNLPISERYHCARSATTRANSPAARTRQHVAASPVVPTHKVGLDGVLTEQHRHRIVDMSGRNVPVRVNALQSPNQSLFECVDHYRQFACPRLGDTRRLPFAYDPANNPELRLGPGNCERLLGQALGIPQRSSSGLDS